MDQKITVTPVVQVVDATGKVKADHPYTIITQAREITYTPRDLGDPGWEFTVNDGEYSYMSTRITLATKKLNGSYYFPNGERIEDYKYFDVKAIDPSGNEVTEYLDAGEYTAIVTGKNGCTVEYRTTFTVAPKTGLYVRANDQTVTYGEAISQARP